jgi:hypothetical protein
MWFVKYFFTRSSLTRFDPKITHTIKTFTKRDNTLTDLLPIVLYILSTLASLNMLLHTYNNTFETDTTTIDKTTLLSSRPGTSCSPLRHVQQHHLILIRWYTDIYTNITCLPPPTVRLVNCRRKYISFAEKGRGNYDIKTQNQKSII